MVQMGGCRRGPQGLAALAVLALADEAAVARYEALLAARARDWWRAST